MELGWQVARARALGGRKKGGKRRLMPERGWHGTAMGGKGGSIWENDGSPTKKKTII